MTSLTVNSELQMTFGIVRRLLNFSDLGLTDVHERSPSY